MLILYILIGVLLLLVLIIMFSSLHVTAELKNELTIKIRFLLFTYRILPKRATEAIEKDIKIEEKKIDFKDLIKDKNLYEVIKFIKYLASLSLKTSSQVFKSLIIDTLNLNLILVGNDAADTAKKYGCVCSLLYPSLSVLNSNVKKVKKSYINVSVAFDEKETIIRFKFKCHIKVLKIFIIVVSMIKNIQQHKDVIKLSSLKNKF